MKPSLYFLTGMLGLTALSSEAAIIASESFNYAAADIVGVGAAANGFSGAWIQGSGSTSRVITVQETGLSMTGVSSSGGSVVLQANGEHTNRAVARPFTTALSTTGTLYGSFLFSYTGVVNASVFGVGLGAANESDGSASFYMAGKGYNIAGGGLQVEGSGWGNGSMAGTMSANVTYLYLFELNAATNTATAWIVTEAQYANFSGALNSAALNAATVGTGAGNVTAKRTVTNASATLGAQTHLILHGFQGTATDQYIIDEIRLSNSNLLEAVTAVPEPSAVALVGLGSLMVLRRRRLR